MRNFVLLYFNHSCHIITEKDFAEFKWKFPNYNMFCNTIIIMKLAFSPPINYATNQALSHSILFEAGFATSNSQATTIGGWIFEVGPKNFRWRCTSQRRLDSFILYLTMLMTLSPLGKLLIYNYYSDLHSFVASGPCNYLQSSNLLWEHMGSLIYKICQSMLYT